MGAHALNLLFLEHTKQFRLQLHGHFTDFVEKNTAALGQLELARLTFEGACKRAFFMPKKGRFEQR